MRLWSHFFRKWKSAFWGTYLYTLMYIYNLTFTLWIPLNFYWIETIYFSSRVNGPGVISLNTWIFYFSQLIRSTGVLDILPNIKLKVLSPHQIFIFRGYSAQPKTQSPKSWPNFHWGGGILPNLKLKVLSPDQIFIFGGRRESCLGILAKISKKFLQPCIAEVIIVSSLRKLLLYN